MKHLWKCILILACLIIGNDCYAQFEPIGKDPGSVEQMCLTYPEMFTFMQSDSPFVYANMLGHPVKNPTLAYRYQEDYIDLLIYLYAMMDSASSFNLFTDIANVAMFSMVQQHPFIYRVTMADGCTVYASVIDWSHTHGFSLIKIIAGSKKETVSDYVLGQQEFGVYTIALNH